MHKNIAEFRSVLALEGLQDPHTLFERGEFPFIQLNGFRSGADGIGQIGNQRGKFIAFLQKNLRIFRIGAFQRTEHSADHADPVHQRIIGFIQRGFGGGCRFQDQFGIRGGGVKCFEFRILTLLRILKFDLADLPAEDLRIRFGRHGGKKLLFFPENAFLFVPCFGTLFEQRIQLSEAIQRLQLSGAFQQTDRIFRIMDIGKELSDPAEDLCGRR